GIDGLPRAPHVVGVVAEDERLLHRARRDRIEPRAFSGGVRESLRVRPLDRPQVVWPGAMVVIVSARLTGRRYVHTRVVHYRARNTTAQHLQILTAQRMARHHVMVQS